MTMVNSGLKGLTYILSFNVVNYVTESGFNPFSVGTNCKRQILTSEVTPRTEKNKKNYNDLKPIQ